MPTAAPATGRQWALRRRRRPQTGARAQAFAGYVFSSGYVLLLLAFGVLPMVYALYLSFTKRGQFVGLDNYVRVFGDFRFFPAVQHVAVFLAIWVVTLTVLVVLLALIVHAVRVRWLFLYRALPVLHPRGVRGCGERHALALLAQPLRQPGVLRPELVRVHELRSNHRPEQPAGDLHGDRVLDRRRWMDHHHVRRVEQHLRRDHGGGPLDGAGAIKTAWYIQIPLMRKWIAYMAVISVAVGTQLFAEPKILAQASRNQIPKHYSLNQLAYVTAFGPQADFNGSAAISILLLVVAAGLAAFFVFRGGLFDRD